MQVSKQNLLPLYHQVKEAIKDMIQKKDLRVGDIIPPERELCDQYGVSRMTVNKAILELVDEGILHREQGKGTFVSKPRELNQILHMSGFTEDMRARGFTTATQILSFELETVSEETKSIMNMDKSVETAYKIVRLRIVENEPFAIETVWIPQEYSRNLTKEMIEGGSLYSVLKEKYGHVPKYARQSIKPIIINMEQSRLLEVKEGELALLFRRTTYLENGNIMEYTETINRSDKHSYEVILK